MSSSLTGLLHNGLSCSATRSRPQTPPSLHGCEFPGSAVLRAVSAVRGGTGTARALLSRLAGSAWMSAYNTRHNSSQPFRVTELAAEMERAAVELAGLATRVQPALAEGPPSNYDIQYTRAVKGIYLGRAKTTTWGH